MGCVFVCVAHVWKPQADVRDPAVNSLPYSLQCFSLILEVTGLFLSPSEPQQVSEANSTGYGGFGKARGHRDITLLLGPTAVALLLLPMGMSTSSSSLLSPVWAFSSATQNLSSLYNTAHALVLRLPFLISSQCICLRPSLPICVCSNFLALHVLHSTTQFHLCFDS